MSYDGTVGALQIGVLISTFLFGVTTLQCIRYFANFPKDKPTIKFMVCVVWLLELAHTISTASGLYHITMAQYNAPQLDPQPKLDLGFRIAVLFSGCIAALVQAYYTDRLRILTENAFLASIYWVLASVRLIGWILATILLLGYDLKTPSMSPAANLRMEISDAIANPSSPVIQPRYTGQNDSSTIGITWPLLPLLAGGAAIDVSITGIICYYVRKSRETIGQVEGAPKIINRLMRMTIQNGLLTGLAGIITAIFLVTMKTNFIWVATFMVLTRLFSNSFLGSLNARERLRQRYRLHTRNNTESSFAGMLPNTSTSTFKFPATPSPPSEPLLAPSVLPWAYQDSLRSSIFSEHSQSQGYTRPGSIASSRRIPAPWLANEHVSGNGNGNGNGNGQGQGQGQGGKGQPRSQSPQRPQWGHLRNDSTISLTQSIMSSMPAQQSFASERNP